MKIEKVFFDLDGVITNTMPFHLEAWKIILKKEGLEIKDYDVYAREGQKGADSVQEIFADYGRVLARPDALRILAEKEVLFKKIVNVQYIPGSLDFLRFLSDSGYSMALVTGTARHELAQYVPQDVLKHFQVIITGTDVQNGKPHPEPYATALKKMNCDPSDAVVIENAPLGIASAKAAGIRCFALETSLPRQYLHQADSVFSSVAELRSAMFSSQSETLK